MGFTDTFRHLYPERIKFSFWDLRDKARKENKGWRLDYIVCSKWVTLQANCLIESEVHNEYWGSDHCPVSATFDFTKVDLNGFQKEQVERQEQEQE